MGSQWRKLPRFRVWRYAQPGIGIESLALTRSALLTLISHGAADFIWSGASSHALASQARKRGPHRERHSCGDEQIEPGSYLDGWSDD